MYFSNFLDYASHSIVISHPFPMCGLAGFAFPENSPSPLPDFKTALKDLTHSGHDDEGFFNFYRCNFRLFVILNRLLVS